MVGDAALRRRAAVLGLSIDAAVREHALLETLAVLGELDHHWALRGGTALSYAYFDIHRLSEDIDLTTPGDSGNIDRLLDELCDRLETRLGTQVEASPPLNPIGGPDLKRVELSWGRSHRLQIDFSWHEPTVRPTALTALANPYPGIAKTTIRAWILAEIMANKWYILGERTEPRDLFDLWFGITHQLVKWQDLVACHVDRYGYPPIAGNLDRGALEARWVDRLAHQIGNLPDFAEAKSELQRHISLNGDVT